MNGVRQEYLYCCVQKLNQEGCTIAEVCDILEFNRSSYYKWIHRTKSSAELENETLLHEIVGIYAEHNGTYRYRRIADEYFAIGKSNNNHLVFRTFDLAIQKYLDAHPLFHSDHEFQYISKQFKAKLDAHNMKQSMFCVGKCIDNSPMEGFWGILKCEMYYLRLFETYEELVEAIEQFIYYYNYERHQYRPNSLSPMHYRSLLEAAQ